MAVGSHRLHRVPLCDQGGVVQGHEDEQGADPAQDQHRVAAMAAAEPQRFDDEAVDQRQRHAGEHGHAEDVLQKGDDEGNRHVVEAEALPHRFDNRLGDGAEQDQEAPEDQRVHEACVGPAQQAPLADHVDEERLDARAEAVEARVGALAAQHGPDQ